MILGKVGHLVLLPSLLIIAARGASPNFMYMLDMIEEDKVAWVDAHNYFRRKVVNPTAANMRLISWDEELAKLAQRVVRTCSFFHTSVQDRKTEQFNPVGENLYTGGDYRFADIMSRTGVTKLWYDEIAYHDINTLTCQAGKECGHYKQLIWATTYKVGCAAAKCRAVQGGHPPYLVSCNYGPIGNAYLGGRPLHPYLVGKPCSKCDDGDICVEGLCNKTDAILTTVTTPVSETNATTTLDVSRTSVVTTSLPATEGITTPVSTTNATTTVVTTSSPTTEVVTTSLPATEGITSPMSETNATTTLTVSRTSVVTTSLPATERITTPVSERNATTTLAVSRTSVVTTSLPATEGRNKSSMQTMTPTMFSTTLKSTPEPSATGCFGRMCFTSGTSGSMDKMTSEVFNVSLTTAGAITLSASLSSIVEMSLFTLLVMVC